LSGSLRSLTTLGRRATQELPRRAEPGVASPGDESSFPLSTHEAAVTGTRRGRPVAVRYLSVGRRAMAFAWARVRDVLDERCR
jgi:hypothetical protein